MLNRETHTGEPNTVLVKGTCVCGVTNVIKVHDPTPERVAYARGMLRYCENPSCPKNRPPLHTIRPNTKEPKRRR